ncbi:hypothetical protein O3P69_008137 [Scylla paramamosain]|uniref:Uncharacterized protein n=1 Tax=Scylla paramamosain TaxID=85552 RepID=A0AAW0T006_SCYPA
MVVSCFLAAVEPQGEWYYPGDGLRAEPGSCLNHSGLHTPVSVAFEAVGIASNVNLACSVLERDSSRLTVELHNETLLVLIKIYN